jgi:hypothetical protein
MAEKRTLLVTRAVNCVGGPIGHSKVVNCEMCKEDCFVSEPALRLLLAEYRVLCEYCAPANPVGRVEPG